MIGADRTDVAEAAAPSGISSVIAASGPYAAELSASRPSIGMPATGPTRCSPFFVRGERPAEQQVADRPPASDAGISVLSRPACACRARDVIRSRVSRRDGPFNSSASRASATVTISWWCRSSTPPSLVASSHSVWIRSTSASASFGTCAPSVEVVDRAVRIDHVERDLPVRLSSAGAPTPRRCAWPAPPAPSPTSGLPRYRPIRAARRSARSRRTRWSRHDEQVDVLAGLLRHRRHPAEQQLLVPREELVLADVLVARRPAPSSPARSSRPGRACPVWVMSSAFLT